MESDAIMGQRARDIVEAASRIVQNNYSRQWLLCDEKGTWERLAVKYLQETAENAEHLGMAADAVDREIANILALTSVTAQVKSRKVRMGAR